MPARLAGAPAMLVQLNFFTDKNRLDFENGFKVRFNRYLQKISFLGTLGQVVAE